MKDFLKRIAFPLIQILKAQNKIEFEIDAELFLIRPMEADQQIQIPQEIQNHIDKNFTY